MKKYLSHILITSLLLITSSGVVFGAIGPGEPSPTSQPTGSGGRVNVTFQSPIKADSVSEVLVAFFKILVQIGAVVVTLAIVYAGFLFVVARGNPEQLNKAKTTLFWTVIGAMVLLGAQVIASVIENTIKKL